MSAGQQQSTLQSIRSIFFKKMSKQATSLTFSIFPVVLAICSLAVGGSLLALSPNKERILSDYGSNFGCDKVVGNEAANCTAQLSLDVDLEAPILLLYQITDFIGNTRQYIDSKSRKQLTGRKITKAQAAQCAPFITNAQMNVSVSWAGYSLPPQEVSSPCGLAAHLYFRDQFFIHDEKKRSIPIRTTSLVKVRYEREKDSQHTQWMDPATESFQIWMQNSISPRVRKLYGIIEEPLKKGNYTIRIRNLSAYHVEVKKHIVLRNEANDYGDNRLLGVLCLGEGTALLFITCFFRYMKKEN